MKYDDLIKLCLEIIQSFNPVILTIDSHSQEFIKKQSKKLADTEVVFIKQVFYGTQRYEEFLKRFTKALFQTNTSTTNRNDAPLYHIFTYLICFRLDELPFHEFKKMVYSQDAVKMNVFLKFLFDIDQLNKYVRNQWIQIYDELYIDNTIIAGIQEKIPQMAQLLGYLNEKATGKKGDLAVNNLESNKQEVSQKKIKKEPTQTAPFKLTQPKPKILPEPIKIQKQIQTKPVPYEILQKTNLKKIEEENLKRLEENKDKVKKQYMDASNQPFQFELEKRPNNLEKIKQEVDNKYKLQCQFDMKHAIPLPKFQEESEVKLTVAAILREEKILKEKDEQEKKRLQDLQENMRDSTEFKNWNEEQKEKEKLEKIEQMQRKKIEMELTRESAIKAYEQKIQENKLVAEQLKQIGVEKMKQKEEKMQLILEQKQKLIEQVLETRDNAQKEKQKIIEYNRKIHDQNKEELEKIFELKKQEDELEKKKKLDLIKQIREMEKQPKKRTKGFDPTETAALGLLEEMSLVELRERYNQEKIERKIQEDEKRNETKQKRDEQLQNLQEKVSYIKQNRRIQSAQRRQERDQKKQKEIDEEFKLKQMKEKSLLELHQKISNKKKQKDLENQRLAKELKEINQRRQYMNANAAIVEEHAWESQQDGLEREIKNRQINKLIDREGIESNKYKERKILAQSQKVLVESKMDHNQQFDEDLQKANKENEILFKQLRDDKKAIYDSVKEFQQEHSKNIIERDSFRQKMSEMSLTNAKNKQQKQRQQQQQKLSKSGQQEQREINNFGLELPGPKYDEKQNIEVN